MKLFYSARRLLFLLCIIVCLSSCNIFPLGPSDTTSGGTPSGGTTSGWQSNNTATTMTRIPLEPNKADLPPYSVLNCVKEGMTRDEVFALVGNPQREEIRELPVGPVHSATSRVICHIYDSSDGPSICVVWGYHVGDDIEVVLTVVEEEPAR